MHSLPGCPQLGCSCIGNVAPQQHIHYDRFTLAAVPASPSSSTPTAPQRGWPLHWAMPNPQYPLWARALGTTPTPAVHTLHPTSCDEVLMSLCCFVWNHDTWGQPTPCACFFTLCLLALYCSDRFLFLCVLNLTHIMIPCEQLRHGSYSTWFYKQCDWNHTQLQHYTNDLDFLIKQMEWTEIRRQRDWYNVIETENKDVSLQKRDQMKSNVKGRQGNGPWKIKEV